MLKQYIIFGKDVLENLALDNMYLGHLLPTFFYSITMEFHLSFTLCTNRHTTHV